MMIARTDVPNAHAAEDDEVCAVCQDGGSDENDPILFCDRCDVPVHKECYRVTKVPEGEWLCDPCTKNVNAPGCAYCPNGGGSSGAAMKLVENGTEQRWACVNCVNFLPELYYQGDDRTARGKVDPARFRLKCSLNCAHKGGAKVQCCYKQCTVAFHVKCALGANLTTHKDKPAFYCERHRAHGMPNEEEEGGANPNQREAAEAESEAETEQMEAKSDAETEPMEVEVEAEVEVVVEEASEEEEEEAAAAAEEEEAAGLGTSAKEVTKAR